MVGPTRTAPTPAKIRVKVSPEEARGGHDRRRESLDEKKGISHARAHAADVFDDDEDSTARRPLNGSRRTTSATLTMLAKLQPARRCALEKGTATPCTSPERAGLWRGKACPWCRPGFAGLVDVLLLMWLAILLEWRRLCTPRRRRCRITSTRGTAHQ